MPPLREPLLQCGYCTGGGRHCTRRYRECETHIAVKGRWKGRRIGPARCEHPIQCAWYISPIDGQVLRPYNDGAIPVSGHGPRPRGAEAG